MSSARSRTSSLVLSVALLLPCIFAQAPGENTSAASFASIAENEVSQFREGITLGAWMNSRGRPEKWELVKPEVDRLYPRHDCAELVKASELADRATVTRTLYFYPPEPRPPYAFPIRIGNPLNACILGMLHIETEVQSADNGAALGRAVREKLTRLFGESVGQGEVPFWGPGFRRDADRWILGAEIVSGRNPNAGKYYYNNGHEVVRGSTVYVYGRLPFEKSRYETYATQDSRYGPIQSAAQFHRAVALAGVDDQISSRFTKLYEQAAQASIQALRQDKAREELLLAVLREWITAIKPMPPARRASGFLAADRFLETANGRIAGWPADSDKPSELQSLGVVFQKLPSEFGGGYFYTRSWEKQARELDPDGPAGQMAILGFMARGSCQENGWGSELFRKVIEDGERLLTKKLDASTAAQVHFMVGDAYSDIVAIAGGLGGPNGEFSAVPAEGAVDRVKALDHYRAGLAIDKTSESAKSGWLQAWRLAAGLLPASRYACYGD